MLSALKRFAAIRQGFQILHIKKIRIKIIKKTSCLCHRRKPREPESWHEGIWGVHLLERKGEKFSYPLFPSALDVFQTTTSPLWKAEMLREQSQTASQGETPPGFLQPSHSSSTQHAWHCHCCLAHRLANLVIYGSRENSEQQRKLLLATCLAFKRRLHRGCFLFPFL